MSASLWIIVYFIVVLCLLLSTFLHKKTFLFSLPDYKQGEHCYSRIGRRKQPNQCPLIANLPFEYAEAESSDDVDWL